MLHALERHGYHITSTQLKNIHLHPTIHLLHQRPPSISKNEIATQLETILSQHHDSGQSLRWDRSYLIGIVRKSGLFVSELVYFAKHYLQQLEQFYLILIYVGASFRLMYRQPMLNKLSFAGLLGYANVVAMKLKDQTMYGQSIDTISCHDLDLRSMGALMRTLVI
jgi:hypothetical protein